MRAVACLVSVEGLFRKQELVPAIDVYCERPPCRIGRTWGWSLCWRVCTTGQSRCCFAWSVWS